MRRSENISRHTLTGTQAKKLIDKAAEKGVKSLSFTGGEPLMFLDDIVELINYAGAVGIPFIRTGTNGFLFRDSEKPHFHKKIAGIAEKLASTKIYSFWISLDSAVPEDHETIRGITGLVKGIEKAVPIFHEHGIYPAVNLGINRAIGGIHRQPYLDRMTHAEFLATFCASIERFYQFALNLGFTMVNACYPMSASPNTSIGLPAAIETSLYRAVSSSSLVTFTPPEKALIFKALSETIPKYRAKLRIFSPRCSLYGLIRKYGDRQTSLYPCRGGVDFFFADCEKGMIHPCGYLQDPQSDLPDLGKRSGRILDCDRCDWECFRDPSDILGPIAEVFSRPLKLVEKIIRDPQFFRLLQKDLRYYRACGYFNGRLAPHYSAMLPFEDN
jgi:MoaA/NifB/PqqE/SkfB family radical SAM enzyme